MKAKILKIAVATILLLNLISCGLYAQSRVTLNLTQDAKLLMFGDDKGNNPGTIDLAFSSEWQSLQGKHGYLFIRPEVEYADLKGGIYRRYSGNIGYTFNQWVDKIEFSASAGFGTLDYDVGYSSFGGNLQTGISLTKDLIFYLDLEITERRDLLKYNSTNEILGTAWRLSGKLGIKVVIFRCAPSSR